MANTAGRRLVAVAVCLAVLSGLFVAHGTIEPDPERNRYPSNDALASGHEDAVGDRVVLGGEIADTDPVVFRGSAGVDDEVRIELAGLDEDVAPGDDVWLAGTVEETGVVAVDSALVRSPWELRYMYAVSFVGGLWVLVRFCRQWRLETRGLAFVPRDGADVRGGAEPVDASTAAPGTTTSEIEEGP